MTGRTYTTRSPIYLSDRIESNRSMFSTHTHIHTHTFNQQSIMVLFLYGSKIVVYWAIV